MRDPSVINNAAENEIVEIRKRLSTLAEDVSADIQRINTYDINPRYNTGAKEYVLDVRTLNALDNAVSSLLQIENLIK